VRREGLHDYFFSILGIKSKERRIRIVDHRSVIKEKSVCFNSCVISTLRLHYKIGHVILLVTYIFAFKKV